MKIQRFLDKKNNSLLLWILHFVRRARSVFGSVVRLMT